MTFFSTDVESQFYCLKSSGNLKVFQNFVPKFQPCPNNDVINYFLNLHKRVFRMFVSSFESNDDGIVLKVREIYANDSQSDTFSDSSSTLDFFNFILSFHFFQFFITAAFFLVVQLLANLSFVEFELIAFPLLFSPFYLNC